MISYKDMTFCNAECANFECKRKLTKQVIADAQKWWGDDNAPIAMSDFSTACDKRIPITTED